MASNTTGSVGSTTTENRTIVARRTETVPAGSRVRHFDELDERTQQLLVNFDGRETVASLTGRVAADVADGDVVVFTDYYRLHVQ